MCLYILFFIGLISISTSGYLPLKKYNGFDDNVCSYIFNDVNYVRTCKDNGKYCRNIGESTSFCEDKPTTISLKTLDEKCDSKYECEDSLYCYSGQCTKRDDSIIHCTSGNVAIRTQNSWTCKNKEIENYCYYKDKVTAILSPDYSKVCGEITFDPTTLTNNEGTKYDLLKIETAYIGTVEDGKFVYDAKACKSGYALPFYPDSSLKDPSTTGINKMYLKCVKVNEIDNANALGNYCIIKYDTDQIYNIDQIDQSIYQGNMHNFCKENLMTELELFNKYINVFTKEKQEQCAKKENYNEPNTCNDNELRKWYYYYTHPSHYILYYNEKGNDVANYLIQQKYPLYESSKYFQINYFLIILILFLF